MSNEVTLSGLKQIRREFDEIGVAASVVGTSHDMLYRLSRMATPVVNALVGARPDVARVRGDLTRALHNLTHGGIDTSSAKRMKDVVVVLDRVIKLEQNGLGFVPRDLRMLRSDVVNSWGYSEREISRVSKIIHDAMSAVDDVGMLKRLSGIDVVLHPTHGEFATYDERFGALVVNVDGKHPTLSTFRALAIYMWSTLFDDADRRAWGSNASGRARMVESFAAMMMMKKSNDIDFMRLVVTASKFGDASQMKARVRGRTMAVA